MNAKPWIITASALAIVAAAGCWKDDNARSPARVAGGHPDRGAQLISFYGCGSCHTIPGIAGADGQVGPPLTDFSRRIYIAGMVRNTPDNLIAWIRDPQSIVPGNVMPKMGIDARDARDIAAYLETIE